MPYHCVPKKKCIWQRRKKRESPQAYGISIGRVSSKFIELMQKRHSQNLTKAIFGKANKA